MSVKPPSTESLRFGLLPEAEDRKGSFATSAAINGIILLLLFLASIYLKPVAVKHQFEQTMLVAPTHEPEKTVVQQPKFVPPPPPPPAEMAKYEAPKIEIPHPEPKPEQKPIQMESKVQAPVLKTATPQVVLAPQPKAALSLSAAAQNNQPQSKVNQVALGQAYSTTMHPMAQRATAALGNPYGTAGASAVHGAVSSTGLQNGAQVGGTTMGHVGSAGLNGRAVNGTTAMGRVGSAGLAQQVASAAAPRPQMAQATTNLEVLSKPAVQYTTEARQLKVQGDVVLRVTFMASGRVVVQGVVHGLGHGLDQEAERVAQQIRFRPATRNGQPVDMTTNITITFQLA